MPAPLTDNKSTAKIEEEQTELLLEAKVLACTRNDTLLFSELEFTLGCGEILQIDGANGSGKTSLIRILCGLAQADEGEVLWRGRDIGDHRAEYLQDLVYVAHANGIKTDLTPLENLAVVRALFMNSSDSSGQDVLTQVGLMDYADLPASNLSSGQRRRLALARLLISDARLWILDEPFTSLDEASRKLVSEFIITHVRKRGSVILTTHDTVDWQDCKAKRINL